MFVTTQPLGGVSVVSIPSISLYFKSLSNTNGLDIQIREVANGMPNYNIVKNSRVIVRSTDKYSNGASVLTTSNNGSAETVIEFKKPVQLSSLKQYALMVLPHASDPNFTLWAANTNSKDQTSGTTVTFGGAVGPLINWDPGGDRTSTINQALKFSINKGFANTSRYHDDNFNFNEEFIVVNDFTAPFVIGETCYMSQTAFNLVSLELYSALTTGSFINGETFYQTLGGGLNSVTGTIYHANSSVLLLTNVLNQPFSNTTPIYGRQSGASAWITFVNNSIMCSNSSNTITFPFTGDGSSSLFYANQSIYLTSSDLTVSQAFIVTSVKSDNQTLQLSWKPSFSDTYCSVGMLRGDGLALKMNYQGYDGIKQTNFTATFNNSTANTQKGQNFHFANSTQQYIIGQSSRARCTSFGTINLEYHNIVPQFHFDQAEENEHVLYWGGYLSYSNYTSQYPAVWRYITET